MKKLLSVLASFALTLALVPASALAGVSTTSSADSSSAESSTADAIAPLSQTHKAKSIESVDGVEAYSTHWFGNAASISADLSQSRDLAYSLTISDKTTFSKVPDDYDKDALIEWGKDPGLGIDVLHDHGFTGKGATVAYIDQAIAGHEQYNGLNLHYTNLGPQKESMHGPAVLSLLAGKDIGTAPDAEVYFYGMDSTIKDGVPINAQKTEAEALYKVIEQNKSLSDDKKITMVAFSDNIDESEPNVELFREAAKACEDAGIMVWFCGEYAPATFAPMSAKNSFENLSPDQWWTSGSNLGSDDLCFVPSSGRTTAATMGGANYIYWSSGGLSWTMPYMTGLYGIVKEIDPSLTQDDIRKLVVGTAYTNTAGMRIVNPVNFVATALEGVGRNDEAKSLRDDFASRQSYTYAVMDTASMSSDDLTATAEYLSTITDSTVLVADAAKFSNARALYDALQADARKRGGLVAGVQIFGTPSMVPAFRVKYRVQMASGKIDEGGTLLTDLFYGNFSNESAKLGTEFSICDLFEGDVDVDLVSQWPVARLPLSKGEFASFFKKYQSFANKTGLLQQDLVNFSNPIFASKKHTDDMGTFLNRLSSEFGFLSKNKYRLYANLRGDYPVTTPSLGGFTKENLTAENEKGSSELLINSHGQSDNIDCCYFESGKEIRESLVNSKNINTVLANNPYYLDTWTCNNGYEMEDNLTTTVLTGQAVGVFSATTVISNNGANCEASLTSMQESNFYYFYYAYLKELCGGATRSKAFSRAQSAYAQALLEHSKKGISKGEGNYQFNFYNLLAYHNFGVVEPNVAAQDLYENAGYITQAGQSVPKQDTGTGGGSGVASNALTKGQPTGDSWALSYTTSGDLSQHGATIKAISAQNLDNGYIRVTVAGKVNAGYSTSFFSPPNGDVFMLHGSETTGKDQELCFDVKQAWMRSVNEATMNFYINGAGKANRFFLCLKPMEILAHANPETEEPSTGDDFKGDGSTSIDKTDADTGAGSDKGNTGAADKGDTGSGSGDASASDKDAYVALYNRLLAAYVKTTAPKGVKAKAVKKGVVVVSWKLDDVAAFDSFTVYRAAKKNGSFKKVASVAGGKKSVKLKKQNKAVYYYKVRAAKTIAGKSCNSKFSKVMKVKF